MTADQPGRRRGDESGFTLIELLVAMMLTGMVMTMGATFYVNVAKSTATARTTRDAMGQTSLAVNAVRNAVTMASDNPVSATATTPAVNAGTSTSLTLTSYSNTVAALPAPSLVTFSLDASGWLTETRQTGVVAASGYWTFTGATTSRRVAGPFILGSGTPFFSYVDSTGAVIALGGTGLATADLSKVAFVRVTAKVANRAVSGSSDPVVTTTSIGLTDVLRNVDSSVVLPTLTGGQ